MAHNGSSCQFVTGLLDTKLRPLWYTLVFAVLVATSGVSLSYGAVRDIYSGDSFEEAVDALRAGDTLIVHQGSYADSGRISITVKGTATSPVLIKGADGETKPIITRQISASVQNTINIEGATYLTIRGLEITGNGGDGINLSGNPSYITLEDLQIHDIDVGVNFRSSMDHITVRKNHIYRTGRDGGTGEGMYVGCNYATCVVRDSIIEQNWIHDNLPGTTQGDGIEVKWGSVGNIIKDNVIHNMGYPGIFVYGSAGTDLNVVERNVVWNCLEGIYAVSDAIVRNNIIFNSGTGLSLYGHEQVDKLENVTAITNTVYNCDYGIYVRWGGTNMVLANNAIYCPGKTALNSLGGVNGTLRANYVEGGVDVSVDNVGFFNGGSYTSSFANAAGSDFWPKSGSILLGKGNGSYIPADDFNGTPRTSLYDLGAYETQGLSTNPGWKIIPGFKQIGSAAEPPSAPRNLRVQS